MTERPEAKRREEALGWLVGRLAWEKGLRFDVAKDETRTTTDIDITATDITATDVAAEADTVGKAARVPSASRTKRAAA